MRQLVFFLEEPSAAAMLEGFLPKIIPADVEPRFITFDGKRDLEQQLLKRLRGYCHPEALFVVMRDQDAQPDCRVIRRQLVTLCKKAGRSSALVRIACRDLSHFTLGICKLWNADSACQSLPRNSRLGGFAIRIELFRQKKS